MGRLLVIRDGARSGADNMAADADLLARRAPGDPTVLRLYRWSPPAVSYGYHQDPDDFDREVIGRRGWGLVRRPTGGRAILHAQELTYAVVGDAPSARFGDDLHAVYSAINGALTEFLRRLGLSPDISQGESLAAARGAVCFQTAGRHEVTVGGRKLVGSAQRRHPDRFLQHGSILTGPAHVDLLDCLRGEDRSPARRAALLAATTNLGELLGRDCEGPFADELEDLLATIFDERFG